MDDDAQIVEIIRSYQFQYGLRPCAAFNWEQVDLMQIRRIGMPNTPVADFKRSLSSCALRG